MKEISVERVTLDMASVSSIADANGFNKGEKNDVPRYALASTTGVEGPDQILTSDLDRVWEANSRIRIKLNDENNYPLLSIPGFLSKTVKKYPDHRAVISRPDINGKRTTITYKEYEKQVKTVAKAFLHLGLERHHSVCILGFNSPQWLISDLAAIYAGGFAAGIYMTNSPEACQHCAENSRANIIVVEDDEQLQKILKIKNNLPDLKAVVQYDGIPISKDVFSWNDLLEIGFKQSDDMLEDVLKTIGINECCTLVYTSGTVGYPKAVMLSHDNLLVNAQAIAQKMDMMVGTKDVMVSFLPLSHIAAQTIDIILPIVIGGTVYMADKNALKGSLINTLIEARPTFILAVPRVWEKIYEKMQVVARNNGIVKNWISNWAKARGLEYHENRINGVDYKSWGYLIAKRLIFDKVKLALGLDRCKVFLTAAAPLSADIKKYFMSLDIILTEAYGMSESAGVHTTSSYDKFRLTSVGHPLPSFSVKLDNVDSGGEGEICMSGRNVFMGYLNNPEKTKETKDEDCWLHSGDLGMIDDDGFLFVTGRIKELVITAGGESIPPVHVEHLVKEECPAISNAFLVGDMRKYLTILIALKTQMNSETGKPLDEFSDETLNWAQSLDSSSTTITEVIDKQDSAIYKEITEAINRANEKAISHAQRVQKFRILPHDFSLPTGELGPTLKLKRSVVLEMYADLIDDMYKDER